jgi:hypothetical protein
VGVTAAGVAAARLTRRNGPFDDDATPPEGGAEGLLLSQGGDAGGYTLYMKDGRLRFLYNYVGLDRRGPRPLRSVGRERRADGGRHVLRYEFEPTGAPDIQNGKGTPGRGELYIDGKLVGASDFPHTTPLFFELEGLSCGFDFGAPAAEYDPPFPFTGTIRQVSVDLAGELISDDEAELRLLMARQ